MIKNTLLGMSCVLMTATVMADENFASQPVGYNTGITYSYLDNHRDVSDTNSYGFKFGYTPENWAEFDVSTSSVIDDNTVNSNQLQGSATLYYGFSPEFGTYGRGELGQRWATDTDFSYGSIGAGLYLKPDGEYSNTQIKMGYRYRDSFENDVDFESHSFVLGGEYQMTPVHSLTAQYEHVDGTNNAFDQNVFSIGYLARF